MIDEKTWTENYAEIAKEERWFHNINPETIKKLERNREQREIQAEMDRLEMRQIEEETQEEVQIDWIDATRYGINQINWDSITYNKMINWSEISHRYPWEGATFKPSCNHQYEAQALFTSIAHYCKFCGEKK